MTGAAAAAMLGVSRRTLYRWHKEGRLYLWEWGTEKAMGMRPRKRGPKRDRYSIRYTIGRHGFDRPNWQRGKNDKA